MFSQSMFPGWVVPEPPTNHLVRSYSTTADILSFKRCRRQYGYFGVRGFSAATNTQRYFGTLVHDVLDQLNRAFRAGEPLPDEEGVVELVGQAHDRLIRSGVRPYSAKQQQERAAKLIHRFVVLIGPHFFPHVRQTEFHLERALRTPGGRDYVLDGVVDVLSGAVSHALNLRFSTEADDVEIWDYKSGRCPQKGSSELRDYEYQMRVYAELYRQQTGAWPARCALVFVGELGEDRRWNPASPDLRAFPEMIYTIHPDPKHVNAALDDFHTTVEAIEAERSLSYGDQWHPPDHAVDQATCEACELRYNCPRCPNGLRERLEPL